MKLHVQLACCVRCSASGRPLTDSGLLVKVDGKNAKLIRKQDGFVLFTNLVPGEHILDFSYNRYHGETIRVNIKENSTAFDVVTLRPMDIAFGNLCHLKLKNLPPFERIFISGHLVNLVLQQEECPAGLSELRLFKKGNFTLVPPLKLLCADETNPEVCILIDKIGTEQWVLSEPLKYAHKRGTKFYLTQPYHVDENAEANAIFFKEGDVTVLCEGKLYELNVKEGENLWQTQL